ncbi:hypothetical protein MMC28_009329 [Mycoblastus sanguinarius]|nr:hypothetical protein [Mycoblastus sanguinarius]
MQRNTAIGVIFACVIVSAIILYIALKSCCAVLAVEEVRVRKGRKKSKDVELAPQSAA